MGAESGQAGTIRIRFTHWRAGPARIVLALVAALTIAAAAVPIKVPSRPAGALNPAAALNDRTVRPRDTDMAMYAAVIARIGQGENYYAVATDELRTRGYPLRPAVNGRLPTLAYLDMVLGRGGQLAAAMALLAVNLIAWRRRLGDEGLTGPVRVAALVLLFAGVSLGLTRTFFLMHELWAGMLLSLAFALHRPGRWVASLAAAAAALAIREHALPFVLLMAALAGWRRDWRETAAWGLLVVAFAVLLSLHLHLVAQHVRPDDPHSPTWLALRGASGYLGNIILASNLRLLPFWLAAPLVVLALFGWSAWDTAAGRFGTLFHTGYAAFFMIASRTDNYYWGFMVSPTILVGLALVPAAFKALIKAAAAGKAPR